MTEFSEHEQRLQQEDIVIAGEKLRKGSFKPAMDGESVPVKNLDGEDSASEVLGEAIVEDSGIRVKIIGLSNGELGLVPSSDEDVERQDGLLSPEELDEQVRKTLKDVGRGLLAAVKRKIVGSTEQAYNAQGNRTSLDPDQPKSNFTPVTEIDPSGEKPQRIVTRFKNNPDSLPYQR